MGASRTKPVNRVTMEAKRHDGVIKEEIEIPCQERKDVV
jgi:hypothetical protein